MVTQGDLLHRVQEAVGQRRLLRCDPLHRDLTGLSSSMTWNRTNDNSSTA